MQTKLDQIANQNHLQMIKALLPHLPADHQKTVSILIKFMEMKNVMNYYNRPPNPAIRSQSVSDTDDASCRQKQKKEASSDLLDILADIRQYCEGEEREMLDQALQMISMIELYRVCAEAPPDMNQPDSAVPDGSSFENV